MRIKKPEVVNHGDESARDFFNHVPSRDVDNVGIRKRLDYLNFQTLNVFEGMYYDLVNKPNFLQRRYETR